MATDKKPAKGILKASSSFDNPDHSGNKYMKWDEMNILATHHPPDKDYGHMKINEPPTPYANYVDPEEEGGEGSGGSTHRRRSSIDPVSEDETENLDAESLAKKLAADGSKPRVMQEPDDSSEEEEDDLTEEEKLRRNVFKDKRKIHYNEFYAVKLAKQLMAEEDEDEEEEGGSGLPKADQV